MQGSLSYETWPIWTKHSSVSWPLPGPQPGCPCLQCSLGCPGGMGPGGLHQPELADRAWMAENSSTTPTHNRPCTRPPDPTLSSHCSLPHASLPAGARMQPIPESLSQHLCTDLAFNFLPVHSAMPLLLAWVHCTRPPCCHCHWSICRYRDHQYPTPTPTQPPVAKLGTVTSGPALHPAQSLLPARMCTHLAPVPQPPVPCLCVNTASGVKLCMETSGLPSYPEWPLPCTEGTHNLAVAAVPHPHANTTATAKACTKNSTLATASTPPKLVSVHRTPLLLLARAYKDRSHCHCHTKHFGWDHPLKCSDQWSRNILAPLAEQVPNLQWPENKAGDLTSAPRRITAHSLGVLSWALAPENLLEMKSVG